MSGRRFKWTRSMEARAIHPHVVDRSKPAHIDRRYNKKTPSFGVSGTRRQNLKRFKKLDNLGAMSFCQAEERITSRLGLSVVMVNRFRKRCAISAVTIRCRVAGIPKLSGQELARGDACLRDLLIAEELIRGSTEVVALQIGKRTNDCATIMGSFKSRFLPVSSHVERIR